MISRPGQLRAHMRKRMTGLEARSARKRGGKKPASRVRAAWCELCALDAPLAEMAETWLAFVVICSGMDTTNSLRPYTKSRQVAPVLAVLLLCAVVTTVDWGIILLRSWFLADPNARLRSSRGFLPHFTPPVLVGHRGTALLHAENTLEAYRVALQLGADVLDADVRRTEDGHLVLFGPSSAGHYGQPAHSCVESSRLEQVHAWDAGFAFSNDHGLSFPLRFSSTDPNPHLVDGEALRVPLLTQFLDEFLGQASGTPNNPNNPNYQKAGGLMLELREDDQLLAEDVLDVLHAYPGAASDVVVTSRHCSVLQHFRALARGQFATAACETEAAQFVALATARVGSLFYSLSPPPFALLLLPLRSRGWRLDAPCVNVLRLARTLGVSVYFFAVNDGPDIEAVLAAGSHGLVTPLFIFDGLNNFA